MVLVPAIVFGTGDCVGEVARIFSYLSVFFFNICIFILHFFLRAPDLFILFFGCVGSSFLCEGFL